MTRRIVLLVALGLAVAACGAEDAAQPAPTAEPRDLYAGIPQDGIHLGDPDAPATLVEVVDLQCPFCAQHSTRVLPAIVDDYVRTGRIRYERRIRSFIGRDSVRAAGAAAYAAEADRLYQFADAFYRRQGPENSGYADAGFIRAVAREVPGLDAEGAVRAADDPLGRPAVRAGERFARRLGSTGTPDFYLRTGGRLTPLAVEGTRPEDFARALDAALG